MGELNARCLNTSLLPLLDTRHTIATTTKAQSKEGANRQIQGNAVRLFGLPKRGVVQCRIDSDGKTYQDIKGTERGMRSRPCCVGTNHPESESKSQYHRTRSQHKGMKSSHFTMVRRIRPRSFPLHPEETPPLFVLSEIQSRKEILHPDSNGNSRARVNL